MRKGFSEAALPSIYGRRQGSAIRSRSEESVAPELEGVNGKGPGPVTGGCEARKGTPYLEELYSGDSGVQVRPPGGPEKWPCWGKGSKPTFRPWSGRVYCTIVVPGEGTHNCAMGTPAHQPTLENYCSIKQLGNQQVRPMWASIPRTIFFKGELRGAQERRRRGDTGASIEAQ